MELKDFKIGADELLEFMNSKISFDQVSKDNGKLEVHFYYKVSVSDLLAFITSNNLKPELKIPSTTPEQRALHPYRY